MHRLWIPSSRATLLSLQIWIISERLHLSLTMDLAVVVHIRTKQTFTSQIIFAASGEVSATTIGCSKSRINMIPKLCWIAGIVWDGRVSTILNTLAWCRFNTTPSKLARAIMPYACACFHSKRLMESNGQEIKTIRKYMDISSSFSHEFPFPGIYRLGFFFLVFFFWFTYTTPDIPSPGITYYPNPRILQL